MTTFYLINKTDGVISKFLSGKVGSITLEPYQCKEFEIETWDSVAINKIRNAVNRLILTDNKKIVDKYNTMREMFLKSVNGEPEDENELTEEQIRAKAIEEAQAEADKKLKELDEHKAKFEQEVQKEAKALIKNREALEKQQENLAKMNEKLAKKPEDEGLKKKIDELTELIANSFKEQESKEAELENRCTVFQNELSASISEVEANLKKTIEDLQK